MTGRGLAYRRHQRQKHINHWKNRIKNSWGGNYPNELVELWARMYARTRKPCSCYICGNRRKLEGKTRKERREEARYATTR